MPKYKVNGSSLTAIADAIRLKTGGTDLLTLDGMASALNNIPTQSATTITPSASSKVAVAKGVYTTGDVTVSGDANLKSENIANGVSIFGVSGTYRDTVMEDAFVTRGSIANYVNNRVSSVGGGAFYGFNKLGGTVDFPNCTTIGNSAFNGCMNLVSASFPACTTIGDYAFNNCRHLILADFPSCTTIGKNAFAYNGSLTTANFPACTTIGNSAFYLCNLLTSVSFPTCTTISSYAFFGCSSLKSVDFPVCTRIRSSAFYNCENLKSVNFPACEYIANNAFCNCESLISADFPACSVIMSQAFQSCTSLTSISFPVCTTISNRTFYGCTGLTTASFPMCSMIAILAFCNCTNLSEMYLPGSTMCELYTSNAFSGTGITSTTGSIYVPLSLKTSYQTATNWAYFSKRIFAIEGEEPDAPTPDEPSVEIITLIIEPEEYEAEKGMTWAEWVDSEYNTGGYINAGHVIVDSSMTSAVVDDEELTEVLPDDVISEDVIYSTVYYHGSVPEDPDH